MRSPKILLADDSATIRKQVSTALAEAGYEVLQAADGNGAVQLASSELPSLAILDIEMPTKDGFAACQEIRQMGSPWSEIPILFLTASRSHALELLGKQLGAYLQKPIGNDVLVRVVSDLVSKCETNTRAEEKRCHVRS